MLSLISKSVVFVRYSLYGIIKERLNRAPQNTEGSCGANESVNKQAWGKSDFKYTFEWPSKLYPAGVGQPGT